jgi:hypothetical protein
MTLTDGSLGASMEAMHRIGVLAVALGYGLSFVALCLAACLMSPAIADHSCCAGDEGIRASDGDCCSVTPGVSHGGAMLTGAVSRGAVEPVFAAAIHLPATFLQPVAVSASPPLILRV